MPMILGINAYHGDSSACLLKDGILIAAAEEERFRRQKHWAGFPAEAIKYCLAEAGVDLSMVDHVAINQAEAANMWRKIAFSLSHKPSIALLLERFRNKTKRANVAEELGSHVGGGFVGSVHKVEHHLAHLSSAFHVSPFSEAAVVSVDGFGDFASAAWGVGRDSHIEIESKVFFPHSLGIFYQALTQFLGFPNYGDEYKVMGLAPYGQPSFQKEMKEILLLQHDGTFELNLKYFRHHRETVEYEWDNGSPHVGRLFSPELETLLGKARGPNEELTQKHMDIARSIQGAYEEAFFNLLNALQNRTGMTNLCLAGGSAMNSVANGKVYENTAFKNIYIQSAAGDAGGAIGAAYSVWHKLGGKRVFEMDHAYWGPQFTNQDHQTLLESRATEIQAQGCQVTHVADESALCAQVAEAISRGKVVGWFQGRMEWGPRALGNRSILGDPRRTDMKDILNKKIKRRESFRPFAPSVLRDAVPEWFEQDDNVPFMMQVYQIRASRRPEIPAVTHVDGSGRLQTVSERTNPRYHKLISVFRDLTGVPMVLNTSFNENEPVVCSPVEAFDCFIRTKMDVLVLGNWVVQRTNTEN